MFTYQTGALNGGNELVGGSELVGTVSEVFSWHQPKPSLIMHSSWFPCRLYYSAAVPMAAFVAIIAVHLHWYGMKVYTHT